MATSEFSGFRPQNAAIAKRFSFQSTLQRAKAPASHGRVDASVACNETPADDENEEWHWVKRLVLRDRIFPRMYGHPHIQSNPAKQT